MVGAKKKGSEREQYYALLCDENRNESREPEQVMETSSLAPVRR